MYNGVSRQVDLCVKGRMMVPFIWRSYIGPTDYVIWCWIKLWIIVLLCLLYVMSTQFWGFKICMHVYLVEKFQSCALMIAMNVNVCICKKVQYRVGWIDSLIPSSSGLIGTWLMGRCQGTLLMVELNQLFRYSYIYMYRYIYIYKYIYIYIYLEMW